MPLKTIDVDALVDPTGNLYESVAILSKRSRQVASQEKAELDEKLAIYDGFEQELEDPRYQEEQSRISLEYELRPEPTEIAIQEMFDDEIYFRDPSADGEE
ncbi:MAG: DNA-directed RNA polymerase subunit omega [Bacteroidetes bacterium]|jgi:DNA-directed RNA polymerase subunit K/omega|nr:DNA-directed RNA polymerase subunit omega [Bacteroidota bacterium]